MKMKRQKIIFDAIKYAVLLIGSVIMVMPFVWMVSTSFKQTNEIFTYPPVWIPSNPTLRAYIRMLTNNRIPFLNFFQNSLFITIIVVIAQVFTSAAAGYTFARLKFKGRNRLFLMYLATMMIPVHATLVPTFIVMKGLNLVDSHWSLILPNIVSVFGTFLLKQFFETIPVSLTDAAKIDGCNPGRVFLSIAMPLSKPALATLAIFVMMGTWNDYIRPLVFLNTLKKYTIPLGLGLLNGTFTTDWAVLMAATTLAVVPVLIAYIAAQDYFVKGVMLSGIK
jgi:multiple sugar transport system permease protein